MNLWLFWDLLWIPIGLLVSPIVIIWWVQVFHSLCNLKWLPLLKTYENLIENKPVHHDPLSNFHLISHWTSLPSKPCRYLLDNHRLPLFLNKVKSLGCEPCEMVLWQNPFSLSYERFYMRVLLFASFFNLFFCSNFKASIFSIFRFKIFCKCWRWASCHAAIFLNRNVIHESWWNIPSSVLWMLCYALYLKLTSNFLPSSIKLFPENKNLTFSGAFSLTFCVRLSNFIKIAWQPCLTVQQYF